MQRLSLLIRYALFAALAARSAPAQRILYDGTRDKSAQDAEAGAKQLASGGLFDKMVANVAAEGKTAAQVQTAQEAEASRAQLNGVERWKWNNSAVYAQGRQELAGIRLGPDTTGEACRVYLSRVTGTVCHSLRCQIEDLTQALSLDTAADQAVVNRALQDIDAQQKALKAAIAKLKDTPGTPPDIQSEVDKLITQAGDAAPLVQEAVKQLGGPQKLVSDFDAANKALGSVKTYLDEALQLYSIVQGIWAGWKAVSVDPASLQPPRQKTDLALLIADQEHFRRLGLIRARTSLTLGDIHRQLADAQAGLAKLGLWESEDEIEQTLAQTRDKSRLTDILRTLHQSTAALSSGRAIVDLSCNQESFETRTWQLRRAAVESGVYETTLQAAAQRLTLYWKSGIKPEQLAQLIFSLTSAATLPVIASKQ